MKNAYHIVTDCHDTDKPKDNRVSYERECLYVKRELIKRVVETNKQGYNSYIIFLGDIYDKGYKDPTKSMVAFDTMVYLNSICKGIYSVIGNHELTYKKDNPFWTLVSNLDPRMSNLPTSNLKINGVSGILKVTDRLEDGNVVFNFNHYGSGVLRALPDKVNIGLFHQNITGKPAVDSASLRGLDDFETKSIKLEEHDVLMGYQYSFFGHFHKYYGKWQIDDGRYLYYLGSLGRPNYSEVSDSYLERTIPCVYVEDGNFAGVEDYKFNLMDEESCLKKIEIEKQVEKRKKRKELMTLVDLDACSVDVVDRVKEKFNNPVFDHIIDSILNDVEDNFCVEIERRDY